MISSYVKVFTNVEGNKWIPDHEQLVVQFSNRVKGMSIIGRKSQYYDDTKINQPPKILFLKLHRPFVLIPNAFDLKQQVLERKQA